MLVHARGEMSACFANVTSITACTRKFVRDARTEPVRKMIFHFEQVLNFKSRINKFDVMGLQNRLISSRTLCCATPEKCPMWDLPGSAKTRVGDLEIVLGQLLLPDTCFLGPTVLAKTVGPK